MDSRFRYGKHLGFDGNHCGQLSSQSPHPFHGRDYDVLRRFLPRCGEHEMENKRNYMARGINLRANEILQPRLSGFRTDDRHNVRSARAGTRRENSRNESHWIYYRRDGNSLSSARSENNKLHHNLRLEPSRRIR